MIRPITYSLSSPDGSHREYLPTLRAFTNACLARGEEHVGIVVDEYRRFICTYQLEEPRSREEGIFELLALGTHWRIHGAEACAVRVAPFRILAFLSEWRKRHQRLKPAIDLLRGIVMSLFLHPQKNGVESDSIPTLGELERLLIWLEATGDYREDALRFIRWCAFFATVSNDRSRRMLQQALTFAEEFERTAAEQLGMFTQNVEEFRTQNAAHYRWREDRLSCLKTRVEYHLGMLGAEIMNRSFRAAFLSADRHAVLVPGCMRAKGEGECRAARSPDGLRCTSCTGGCAVNQLRAMGAKHDFEVYIVPHASDISRWVPRAGEPVRGVVGVACLPTLLAGGWELKRYHVPAQCVVLNESGCQKHWHPEGFPTAIDMREMKRIVTRPA